MNHEDQEIWIWGVYEQSARANRERRGEMWRRGYEREKMEGRRETNVVGSIILVLFFLVPLTVSYIVHLSKPYSNELWVFFQAVAIVNGAFLVRLLWSVAVLHGMTDAVSEQMRLLKAAEEARRTP